MKAIIIPNNERKTILVQCHTSLDRAYFHACKILKTNAKSIRFDLENKTALTIKKADLVSIETV